MTAPPPAAAVSTVVALLQQLGGSASDAAHVATALERYGSSVREDGMSLPPALRRLRAAFAEASTGSRRVTGGHDGSEVEEPLHSAQSGLMPDLLTREQTAARLRCSVATVKRRERDGLLAPVRHGRVVRHHRVDIDALLGNKETS